MHAVNYYWFNSCKRAQLDIIKTFASQFDFSIECFDLTGVSLLSLFERFEYEVQLSSFDISQHYNTTTWFCWAALTDWKRERVELGPPRSSIGHFFG